jgi:hypothetical protein
LLKMDVGENVGNNLFSDELVELLNVKAKFPVALPNPLTKLSPIAISLSFYGEQKSRPPMQLRFPLPLSYTISCELGVVIRENARVHLDESSCSNKSIPHARVDITTTFGVFCLSLMGTNLADFIREAHRIMKRNGRLKIVEVGSRFAPAASFRLRRQKRDTNGYVVH